MVVRELINLIGFEVNEGQLRSVEDRMKSVSEGLNKAGRTMSLYVTAPLTLIAGMALKTSANLEGMQIAFETMLGSAAAATKLVKDLIDFTAKTPFQLPDVQQNAKLLMAYGVSLNDLIPTMTMLGDVAAGVSVPLERVARAYGQVQTKGRLLGDDLRQFTEAGIPLLDYLAQLTGIAKKDLPDAISKSKISAEMVTQAFQMMTGEGGKFNRMMEKQSKSLAGVWSNLIDSTTLLLASIGNAIDRTFKIRENLVKLTQILLKIADWFKNASPAMQSFVVILGAILAGIGPLLIGLGALAGAISLVSGALAALMTVSVPLLATIAGISAAVIAAILAFLLVFDDVDTWIKGGDSITGALLGPFKEWSEGLKEIFDGVNQFVEDFFSMLLTGKWEPVVKELKTFLFIVWDVFKSFMTDIDNLFLGGAGGRFLSWASKIANQPVVLGSSIGGYNPWGTLEAAGATGGALSPALAPAAVGGAGGTSSTVNVKSTIQMTVPEGTKDEQVNFVRKAAEESVRETFERQLRTVITNNSGAR